MEEGTPSIDGKDSTQWNVAILKYSSLILFIGSIFYGLTFLFSPKFQFLDVIPSILASLTALFSLYFTSTGKHEIAANIFAISLWFTISIAFFWTGGIYNPLFMLLLLTILISGLILKPRGIVILTLLNMLTSGLMFILANFGYISHPESYYIPLTLFVAHIFTYLLIGVVMYYINTTILQQISLIQEQAKETYQARVKYEMLLDQAADPIIVSDENENILEVNQETANLLHYSKEELLSMKMTDLLVKIETKFSEDVNISTLSKLNSMIIEREMVRRDGIKIYVEGNIKLLPNNTIQSIFRDIQTRKLKEKVALQAIEKDNQNQKMQALGRMAGSIAHDFNNLLAAIYGYSDIGLLLSEDANIKENFVGIQQAAQRGKEFAEELLQISKRQTVDVSMIDLHPELTNMKSLIQRLVPANIILKYNLDPESQYIMINLNHFHQVIINLVVNSVQAIGDQRGIIEISTVNRNMVEIFDLYNIKVDGTKSWMEIRILDDGIGIPQDQLKNIFDPFYTTKPEGTGLGLSTVYGIITQNRGVITVTSELNKGTTFTLLLPVVHDHNHEQSSDKSKHEVSLEDFQVLENLQIVLVEDELMIRETLTTFLERNKAEVYTFENGNQCIAYLQSNKILEIDLIISDLMMPNMNGDDLLRRIRGMGILSPCLFISGYPDTDYFDTLSSKNVDEQNQFLGKPFTFNELVTKISEIIIQ